MISNKFLKAGLGYTIGNFLLKGITFLTIPLFSRLLSPTDYGYVNVFLSYDTILSIIIGLGFHASIKNAKYEFDNIDEYCSTILFKALKNGLFFLVLVNILYTFLPTFFPFNRIVISLLVLQSLFSCFILIYNNRVSLEYQYKKFLKISFFNTVGNIIVSIVLILTVFSHQRYLGRILGITISTFIVAIYIVIHFFKQSRPTKNKKYLNFALKFSLPLIPHGLSQVILSQFDRIMINSMVGTFESGLYSFCTNISLIPTVINSSIDQVWMTWFFEKMNQKEYEVIGERAKKMLCLFSFIICFFCSLSPEIIKILAPITYWKSTECVIPIVLSVYFIFLYSFPSYIEYYFKKTKAIALGSMLAAIINIVLNYLMIKKFGYIAAAYTTVFAYFLYFIYHWIISIRITDLRLYNIKFFICLIFFTILNAGICIYFINYLLIRLIVLLIMFVLFVFTYLKFSK
ncbi:MAG: oligosaccharide flippase family protein [Beduini sp.]|uniref:oligosaccharide flippase family protein n=1 Tax=Beduini sp. TaxID=1922300 RepID=UPI0039A10796